MKTLFIAQFLHPEEKGPVGHSKIESQDLCIEQANTLLCNGAKYERVGIFKLVGYVERKAPPTVYKEIVEEPFFCA